MLGLQNEREWKTFCEQVLRHAELSEDPRFSPNPKRLENREELQKIIDEVFFSLTGEQLVERLEAAQIANARVNEVEEVWNHPQFAARNRWRQVDSPAGPVPALGAHTGAILAELGYSATEVAAMQEKCVV